MVATETSTITSPPPSLPPPETPTWDNDDDDDDDHKYLIPKPSEWFPKLVSLLADLIYNCMSTLCSPIFSLLSVASETYHQVEEAKATVESAVHKVPSTLTHGTAVLLKKLGFGILGAAYVSVVLLMVLLLSILVGIALVNLWVEEPVFLRQSLHFDYTEPHPTAVFAFHHHQGSYKGKPIAGVPAGHTFYVSLELLMPESDFNRAIGVFQVSAEVVSGNGDVIAKSSQPCMLRFRSLPVRLTRTFLMSVPLLLGISGETQKLKVQILKHKEGRYPRTRAIRVTLHPRAGTSYLPQLYEAEIVMNSKLPWSKQLLHSWKWTFYVWTSLYVYVMLLIFLFLCCKPLLFPMAMITTSTSTASTNHVSEPSYAVRESAASELPRPRGSRSAYRDAETEDVQELLRKWQRSRSKRKAIYLQADLHLPTAETMSSSGAASTISMTREDASIVSEDVGDSESVSYKED